MGLSVGNSGAADNHCELSASNSFSICAFWSAATSVLISLSHCAPSTGSGNACEFHFVGAEILPAQLDCAGGVDLVRPFGNLRRNRIDLMHRVMFYES
jgi:hypothetical protein